MKYLVFWILAVLPGCSSIISSEPSETFSFEAPNIKVKGASDGVVTFNYNYPICLVASDKNQNITLTTNAVKAQSTGGMVNLVAGALGFFLRYLLGD